jgi:hypothetical protein
VSAFGLDLTIEKTTDKIQMEYELYKYVMNYIEDFKKASEAGKFIDHHFVDPRDWTPMNLEKEDMSASSTSAERWAKPLISKNCFLFQTSRDAVEKLLVKYEVPEIPGLASGIPVIVKYLSAVLDYNYVHSAHSLATLLKHSDNERKRSAEVADNERKRSAEVAAAVAAAEMVSKKRLSHVTELYHQAKRRIASMTQELTTVPTPDVPTPTKLLEDVLEDEDGDDIPRVGTTQVESDTPPTATATATTISYVEDVVHWHPYIGIFYLTLHNPMIVMYDAGESLYILLYCTVASQYRFDWQLSIAWR